MRSKTRVNLESEPQGGGTPLGERGCQDGEGLRRPGKTKVLLKPALLQPLDSVWVPGSDVGALGSLSWGCGGLQFSLVRAALLSPGNWGISIRSHWEKFSAIRKKNVKLLHETQ